MPIATEAMKCQSKPVPLQQDEMPLTAPVDARSMVHTAPSKESD